MLFGITLPISGRTGSIEGLGFRVFGGFRGTRQLSQTSRRMDRVMEHEMEIGLPKSR